MAIGVALLECLIRRLMVTLSSAPEDIVIIADDGVCFSLAASGASTSERTLKESNIKARLHRLSSSLLLYSISGIASTVQLEIEQEEHVILEPIVKVSFEAESMPREAGVVEEKTRCPLYSKIVVKILIRWAHPGTAARTLNLLQIDSSYQVRDNQYRLMYWLQTNLKRGSFECRILIVELQLDGSRESMVSGGGRIFLSEFA